MTATFRDLGAGGGELMLKPGSPGAYVVSSPGGVEEAGGTGTGAPKGGPRGGGYGGKWPPLTADAATLGKALPRREWEDMRSRQRALGSSSYSWASTT